MGIGLVLRLALLSVLGAKPLADDAADYHRMAVQLLGGQPFEPDWPPGLPLYLALAYRLAGAHELVGRSAMLLVYLGFAAALYALTRRVVSQPMAVLLLILFAVAPSYVYFSVTTLTQLPTAALLAAAACAALATLERPSFARATLLGMSLAGLVLVRPSSLLLCLATPPLLAWSRRRLALLVAPALVLALGIGAWTAQAHALTGRYLLINNANSQNLFYGNNPWTPLYRTWWFGSHKPGEQDVPDAFTAARTRLAGLPPSERDRAFSRYAIDHIRTRPDLFLVRSLARLRTFFAFDTFTAAQLARRARAPMAALAVMAVDGGLYMLIGLGAIASLLEGAASPSRGVAAWVLGLGTLLYAAPYFVSFAHPTYHFPIVPLLAVLAAAALDRRLAPGAAPVPWPMRRRIALITASAIFVAIQVEWAVNMASRLPTP